MHHCGEFRVLVGHAQRFVAVCTCGALHLQWDAWGLQVHPSDLDLIERALERSHHLAHGQFAVERGSMASFAVSCEHSAYRFWYGKSSLLLNLEGFVAFRQMLQTAKHQTPARLHSQFSAVLGIN
jgi:hypothetical protein